MAQMEARDDEVDLLMRGQAEIWRHMFAFADSMALKCAVELRIADVIHAHGGKAQLTQIVSSIGGAPPDSGVAYLARIMRLLVRNKIFSADQPSDNVGEPVYGLTDVSRWLVRDTGLTLAPMVLLLNHPWSMAPWHMFSQSVKDGAMPFEKAHGCSVWEFASKSADFNKIFNDAMACFNPLDTRAVLAKYKDVFGSNIESMVDVGGGVGAFLAEIVKLYPHIKGINFDLPHVINAAPRFEGVTHVAGSMFEFIPKADVVVLKAILHNWGDEDCVKILQNCRKSIDEKTGKLIIIDRVLEPEGDDPFDGTRLVIDILMLAQVVGGMERTKKQWKIILEEGGFSNYKIIKLPTLPCIIEAYPA